MAKFIAWDNRLSNTHSVRITQAGIRNTGYNDSSNLSQFVADARTMNTRLGKYTLEIWCHGWESDGQGGYGLQFCHEGITLRNVTQIGTALSNKVDLIITRACQAANRAFTTGSSYIGHYDQQGDGMLLCQRLAVSANVPVVAAVQNQLYSYEYDSSWFGLSESNERNVDFGNWEGGVFVFAPGFPPRWVNDPNNDAYIRQVSAY